MEIAQIFSLKANRNKIRYGFFCFKSFWTWWIHRVFHQWNMDQAFITSQKYKDIEDSIAFWSVFQCVTFVGSETTRECVFLWLKKIPPMGIPSTFDTITSTFSHIMKIIWTLFTSLYTIFFVLMSWISFTTHPRLHNTCSLLSTPSPPPIPQTIVPFWWKSSLVIWPVILSLLTGIATHSTNIAHWSIANVFLTPTTPSMIWRFSMVSITHSLDEFAYKTYLKAWVR